MKRILLIISCFSVVAASSQGNLGGNITDEQNKSLAGASIEIIPLTDSLDKITALANKDGAFFFEQLPFGYYQLRISYADLQTLVIDSINLRAERPEFSLGDLVLKSRQSAALQEVIIFAEKPLIQSKDGNITFNVAESPLSAGANASELLETVPMVSKDEDGKISVRGKEPKILIDDKPVELNLQQLQDLLESMPGSSIEKIEVMTNPPPQYANEQGGVINIVTRKGRVGRSARIGLSAGSRGESSATGNFTYRKQGFALNINAGGSYNRFTNYGYSIRNNVYTDSSNFFNTASEGDNKSFRPNLRVNMDYDINKFQSLNFVLHHNRSDFSSNNLTEYRNINRFDEVYRLSERNIYSEGDNQNTNLSFSYRLNGKTAGETLRVIASADLSANTSNRDFYQQYFNPDHTPNGVDSIQQQLTDENNRGYNARVNYDKPLKNRKTFFSFGSAYIRSNNDVVVDASSLKKPDNVMVPSSLLSNEFRFHQTVVNLRVSMKQLISENFSISGGLSGEKTNIWFELLKEGRDAKNNYTTLLPFANINKSWGENKLTLNLVYRRSIRRPTITQLNPTIDFSDPYNTRFGNEKLEASTSDNFDLVAGINRPTGYINMGMGYNIVKDIFSRVRTLLPDGKTQITWENISGRKEYEISTWSGLTLTRKLRANFSASYTFNQYSAFDKLTNRYRNGGSFTSKLASTFTPSSVWNFTGSFTVNRFANPQGFARWNSSMNIGLQRKLLDRKLVITINAIDPLVNQERQTFTYGPRFSLESFRLTRTRNFRLSVSYNFTMAQKKNNSLKF